MTFPRVWSALALLLLPLAAVTVSAGAADCAGSGAAGKMSGFNFSNGCTPSTPVCQLNRGEKAKIAVTFTPNKVLSG